MRETQVRVAVIGCGYWGINYIRVCTELPNCEVEAICDQSLDRLTQLARRFPSLERTSRLENVWRNPGIEAVIVATPPTTHYDVVRDALLSGKHVLVEKPLTTAVGPGSELVELAAQTGRVLMVGHTFLYNNGVQKVKEYVDQESFGTIYYLHSTRTNLGPIRHDVNVVWDLAPHDISIFNYILGTRPIWASATGSRLLGNQREDVAFITLGYPDNVIGNIHVSWADPNKVRETVVVGSNRRIVFDDLSSLERVRIYEKGVSCAQSEADNFGEFRLRVRDGDIISPRIEISEPLKDQCTEFLNCIRSGKSPRSDGQCGLDVLRVLDAIDVSLKTGGTPAEVRSR